MGIANIIKDLERIIAGDTKKLMEASTEGLVERIQRRTRLGNGVKKDLGSAHKLPKLKESTKKTRKRLKKTGDLTGPGATPAKSGLNRTGEMLESMDRKVTNSGVEISLSPSQQEKAEELLKLSDDWSFMKISKAEFKGILDKFEDFINRKLKKFN